MMTVTDALAWLVAPLVLLGVSSNAVAKTYKWQCVYTQRASPEGLVRDHFSIEFALDDITGKAVIIGNQGVADIEAHEGFESMTFIEKLATGVAQTTTIAKGGRSVHSRHTIMGTEMMPSQYYGQCRIQR